MVSWVGARGEKIRQTTTFMSWLPSLWPSGYAIGKLPGALDGMRSVHPVSGSG